MLSFGRRLKSVWVEVLGLSYVGRTDFEAVRLMIPGDAPPRHVENLNRASWCLGGFTVSWASDEKTAAQFIITLKFAY